MTIPLLLLILFFNLLQPQMKYLAAYALLALSGKKDICTHTLIQPLLTSKLSLAVFNHMPLIARSIKLSKPAKENPFTNLLLTDKADWEAQAPPLPKLPTRNKPPRNRHPRRKSLKRSNNPRKFNQNHLKNNKTQIWETCSDDTREHI